MRAYRIEWSAIIEDRTVLDGRSLVYADSPEQAIDQLIVQKTKEYRLKSEWLRIQTVMELPYLQTDEIKSGGAESSS
ncbi:hypothetical protein [Thermaerobacillus caldiproteolyticus]|uniref:Uncharacterized protein n=1 Tax=Thermaerobacillus caldiproteolyticus TaxID=247480 RepID=A0A7V9Z9H7_9BACL|nr:hypothetical protein [Anoxybacillus caldiproteolyticus]MBA2876502.1 hypothetical protein [Anoxybacillus caldiproteolyticus]QPA31366.1 hypothetical protein ISX45_18300 [Anoxybacillus caldiproteolyticus]